MGEADDQQPAVVELSVAMGLEAITGATQPEVASSTVTHHDEKPRRMWWIRVFIYIVFVLVGQSAATLLGRLYYDKGGNSKWIGSLVQFGGFPILLPLYFLTNKNLNNQPPQANSLITSPVSLPVLLALAYTSMGILIAGFSLLYALGLMYLPVSTYSLICASQLGFNALFSFFLNCQKFTPYILNSLVLLTLSSILLVFQNPNNSNNSQSQSNFAIGFLCTVGASAGYGLLLTLTQLFFDKVVRKRTFKVVVDVLVYPPAVATLAAVVGLFGSGEWKEIGREMERFEFGRVSYVMTLVWTTVCWQVFGIGCVGLIFEVSSLFSNVIGTLGLPVVPILAVVCFRDEMGGLKVVAMLLALWGFVSYLYSINTTLTITELRMDDPREIGFFLYKDLCSLSIS